MTSARPGRRRLLVLVHGSIGPRMSGPEIRGWELARALARTHEVTVAARAPAGGLREGIRIVPSGRRELVREALAHDAVIGPSLPPYLLLALRNRGVALVSDQYDPVDLEVATLGGSRAVRREVAARRAHLKLQLRFADMLLCANERQRERLHAQAREMSAQRKPVDVRVVAMGIPDEGPDGAEPVLRARFEAVALEDVVVLWWGSIWRWFDAETAIRAVAELAGSRPRVRLVITAGPPADQSRDRMLELESARRLAASLGVLGRQVLFLDEWIPYERRGSYLRDADIGISLHRGTPEARLAARSRYMDYLWASLPCVLAEGDETAKQFGDAGFATTVPARDVPAVKAALTQLVDDEEARRAGRAAGAALADSYRWSSIVERWTPVLEQLMENLDRQSRAPGLARAVAAYYRLRGVDKARGAARSMLNHASPRAS